MVTSNISNFLVVWIAAFQLNSSEFGLFSFWLATAQLLTVVSFDWLRTAVIRWSAGRPEFLASIVRLYALVTLGLFAVASGIWAVGLGPLGFLVAFYSMGQASFDLLQAYYRTRFADRALVLTATARAILAPITCFFAVELLRNHAVGLAALGLSFVVVSALPLWGMIRWIRSADQTAGPMELGPALALGTTMSVANMLYYAIQSATRGLAILLLPSAEAAATVFTLDVVQRVFVALGTALNLVVLQGGIARVESEGKSALSAAVGAQIAFGYALLLPALVGFSVIGDAFALHLVPKAYSEAVRHFSIYAAISAALMTLKIYSMDSAFILLGRGKGAILSSALGGMVTLVVIGALHYAGLDALSIWFGVLVGSLTALSLSYFIIVISIEVKWPISDIVKATVSSVPLLFLFLVPSRESLLFLATAPLVGGIAYGAGIYISKAFRPTKRG